CSSARPLRGVERIEKTRKGVGRNAAAVILNGNEDVSADAPCTDLDAAILAYFSNGLFGIADEVEEDLHELIGVADHRRQAGLRLKFDSNVVTAQRMLVQLEGALNEAVYVRRFLLR